MNVLVTSESRFVDVDGTIYGQGVTPTFLERYLPPWDEVLLLARVARAANAPSGASPMNMKNVRLVGLPDFHGALQYVKSLRTTRQIAQAALQEAESVLVRVPGVIGTLAWSL